MTMQLCAAPPTGTRGPDLRISEAPEVTSNSAFRIATSSPTTFRFLEWSETDGPKDRFVELADTWHSETGHLSSPSQIAMHPAYQRIIGMGSQVIPWVLNDLRIRGGQWYWALRAITGASPVPLDAAGNVRMVKNAWLQWGKVHGYVVEEHESRSTPTG